jgi:hypothetical protein
MVYNTGGGVPRPKSVGDSRVLLFTAESVPADSHRRTSAVKLPHDPKAGKNIPWGAKILVQGPAAAACVCVCSSECRAFRMNVSVEKSLETDLRRD